MNAMILIGTFVNGNTLSSVGELWMRLDTRMRLSWHFEVASPGCLNRKADMLVRLLKKIGYRLLFFQKSIIHENQI